MNVMIAGGSGLIGLALTRSLLADGHKTWILSRNPGRMRLPSGAQSIVWDAASPSAAWLETFSQMDAVVNLAGATIGQYPWSEARKKSILDSRVGAGQAMTQAFQKAARKPAVYIQASGIGYYGPKDADVALDEYAPAGNDFLARVAVNWEASSRLVETMGVRRVVLRSGLVLAREGGVLPLMALPPQFFGGGPLGDGKQGISWIHLDDEVRAIRFVLENDKARGPFNLCAPNPLSNADFMRQLCAALGRPCWLRTPSVILRLALGEMSDLLLTGQYAIPQKLTNLGFSFNYQTISEALRDLY